MEKTKIVNDPQQLTLFGERTPRAVIYKSESHKLHQAFNVKAGEKIVQGMPVALNEEGLIYPCTDTATQAGYVTPDGELLNDRFVKANQATSTQFIALNPAEEANEVIQVLIK